jgi:hypothetical protein
MEEIADITHSTKLMYRNTFKNSLICLLKEYGSLNPDRLESYTEYLINRNARPSELDELKDFINFNRMPTPSEIMCKVVDLRNNKKIIQFPKLQSKLELQKKNHDALRKRFLDLFDEDRLEKFLKRWVLAVYYKNEEPDYIPTRLYEYLALQDFFEALRYGPKGVIERSIDLGMRNCPAS